MSEDVPTKKEQKNADLSNSKWESQLFSETKVAADRSVTYQEAKPEFKRKIEVSRVSVSG